MKVDRAIRCALVLFLASATISLPRTTLARAEADTLHPPATTIKKGTAHIGCAYTIYLTIQSTLTICFPNEYSVLHKHVDKWIPIMRKYADDNAANERQKFNTPEENRDMEKFRKNLDGQMCNNFRPSIEQFSKVFTGDLMKTERGLVEMLQKSDDPNGHYGCL